MASKYWKLCLGLIALTGSFRRAILLPTEEQEDVDPRQQAYDDKNQDWAQLFAENYHDVVGNSLQAGLDDDVMTRVRQDGDDEEAFSGRLEVVEPWPVKELSVGEIGGVATDPEGYVYVFHRAGRQWTDQSFDNKNVFAHQSEGAIKEATILKLNASNGIVLDKTGADKFYLPHGLTIDSKGNKWITDVAMHQVFKFEADKKEPTLTLGKKFEPAVNSNDTERFCKPTDVAVTSNGDFFVSDGYCSSRIMKFDKDGKFLTQFGVNDFDIAHSLALAEDLDLICGADREGMRVLCYNAGIKDASRAGEAEREYTDEGLGRVYSIAYSQPDGVIYGVTGVTGILIPQGFTIDMRDDEHYRTDFIAAWSPEDQGFDNPHALAVSADGESVFVGEMSQKNPLWKLVKEQLPY